jgi:hypothetical protein
MWWSQKTHYPQARFRFDGVDYRWSGWFGCQLASYEWKTVPAGTRRTLNFGIGKPSVDVTVFSTTREGLRVRTAWAVDSSGPHAEHERRIYGLRDALRNLV